MSRRRLGRSLTALALLAVLVFAASSHSIASGQAIVGTANVGGTSYGVAYDSGKGEIFVTHFFNASISVLSDSRNAVVGTIQFGVNYEPIGIAYDSAKGELFVANYGANTVSIISDATDGVIQNVSVGAYPEAVAYDSGKGEIFVASGTSRTPSEVSVISDVSNSVVATVPVGSYPTGLAYDPATSEVFVTNYALDTVSVISDSDNNVTATVPVGSGPYGVAYDSGKGEIFVTNAGDGTVSVISDATDKVTASVTGLLGPSQVAYDSGTGEVFVAEQGNLTVTATDVGVISDTSNTVTTDIDTGSSNTVLAYDSGKDEVFVGSDNDFTIDVISDSAAAVTGSSTQSTTSSGTGVTTTSTSTCFSSGSIGAQLSVSCTSFTYDTSTATGGPGVVGVGLDPIGLAYDSGTGEVFVAEFSAPAVAAISDSNNSVVASTEVPGLNNPGFSESPSPQYVAYDSGKGELFASNLYGNCITVISDATNSVVTTIDLGNDTMNNGIGGYPVELAYDSAKGEVFVVEQGASTIVGQYSASAGFVSVISDTSNSVVATIPLGDFPGAIAYDPAAGEMFVAEDGAIPSSTSASNTAAGQISVISDTTNSVVANITVGPFPDGITYDSAKGELFVASSGSTSVAGSVAVISGATNAIITTIPLNAGGSVAYDSGTGDVWVLTPRSNSTAIISDATNTVIGTKAAGPAPFEIVYDSGKGELFVSNPSPADTVTVISDSAATSATTTTTSSKSSGLALEPGYLALLAVNVMVLIALLAVGARRMRGSVRSPSIRQVIST